MSEGGAGRSRGPELALGAIVRPRGVDFRLWAPRPTAVELVLPEGEGETTVPMRQDGEYWVAHVEDARPGTRYAYRLEGDGPFPDPCSRSQPDGVHGPSEVVDPRRHRWGDDGWRPPTPWDLVIYECHIGTLTPGGTFDAAIGELRRLRELGVTAIELMPVASFAGRWNWGYDGVALFAPAAPYGGPEGLRRLVDAAHQAGLAVILDVVYNHFGPSGNYTGRYSEHYLTAKHETPWGSAVNFDDAGGREVRRFVVENLLHWLHEYHIDGFRFDATHAIHDESAVHILAELSDAVRAYPRDGHVPYLIAESHENDVRYLRSTADGGFGFDGVWADDFHHAVRTMLTREGEAYFRGFAGNPEQLGRTIEQGFFYEGQLDPALGEPRGTRAREQPWYQFVYCIQNHDQVGNRAFGERLNGMVARADFLAASLLLLSLPQTPLLFQGQEYLASTPFLYFTDHEPDLGRLVTEGRRREFAGFAAFRDPALRERIPDPQAPETFYRSKLRPDEAAYGGGQACIDLYRALLRLRATDPVLGAARRRRPPMRAWGEGKALLVELRAEEGRRLIAVNFGDETELPLGGGDGYEVILHTDEPRFGGNALAPRLGRDTILLPSHQGAFLRSL